MTSEPTTAAGRALLERWKRRLRGMPSLDGLLTGHDIAAIEAEACAAERAELGQAIIDLGIEATELRDQLAAEKDRVRRLREALPYASHLTMCDANRGIGRICTCGWKDLLRDLGGPRLPEQPDAPAEPQPFDEADNMCPNCVTP